MLKEEIENLKKETEEWLDLYSQLLEIIKRLESRYEETHSEVDKEILDGWLEEKKAYDKFIEEFNVFTNPLRKKEEEYLSVIEKLDSKSESDNIYSNSKDEMIDNLYDEIMNDILDDDSISNEEKYESIMKLIGDIKDSKTSDEDVVSLGLGKDTVPVKHLEKYNKLNEVKEQFIDEPEKTSDDDLLDDTISSLVDTEDLFTKDSKAKKLNTSLNKLFDKNVESFYVDKDKEEEFQADELLDDTINSLVDTDNLFDKKSKSRRLSESLNNLYNNNVDRIYVDTNAKANLDSFEEEEDMYEEDYDYDYYRPGVFSRIKNFVMGGIGAIASFGSRIINKFRRKNIEEDYDYEEYMEPIPVEAKMVMEEKDVPEKVSVEEKKNTIPVEVIAEEKKKSKKVSDDEIDKILDEVHTLRQDYSISKSKANEDEISKILDEVNARKGIVNASNRYSNEEEINNILDEIHAEKKKDSMQKKDNNIAEIVSVEEPKRKKSLKKRIIAGCSAIALAAVTVASMFTFKACSSKENKPIDPVKPTKSTVETLPKKSSIVSKAAREDKGNEPRENEIVKSNGEENTSGNRPMIKSNKKRREDGLDDNDVSLNDNITLKENSRIYTNAYYATNRTNGQRPHYSYNDSHSTVGLVLKNKDNIISLVSADNGKSYEFRANGQCMILSREEASKKVNELQRNGYSKTAVAVKNVNASQGVTGFYNVDSIGGKTK